MSSNNTPEQLLDIALSVVCRHKKLYVIELIEQFLNTSDLSSGNYITRREKSSAVYATAKRAEKASLPLHEELEHAAELALGGGVPLHGNYTIPLTNKLFPNRKLVNGDLMSMNWHLEIVEIPFG